MYLNHPRVRELSAALLALVVLAGCGGGDRPSLGDVSGIVTLDGKALPKARVLFMPDGRRASVGITDDQGQYNLVYLRDILGAAVGDHRVSIQIIPAEEGVRVASPLPAKYNVDTELKATVTSGTNTIDFALSSK